MVEYTHNKLGATSYIAGSYQNIKEDKDYAIKSKKTCSRRS